MVQRVVSIRVRFGDDPPGFIGSHIDMSKARIAADAVAIRV